jgi:hypothetical protein
VVDRVDVGIEIRVRRIDAGVDHRNADTRSGVIVPDVAEVDVEAQSTGEVPLGAEQGFVVRVLGQR